jgi:cytidyltransferase-like protein
VLFEIGDMTTSFPVGDAPASMPYAPDFTHCQNRAGAGRRPHGSRARPISRTCPTAWCHCCQCGPIVCGTAAQVVRCAYDEPVENLGAPIVSFEAFDADRPTGRVVATSGGFDPIHPGHISSLQASAEFGDVVVAIVNGDAFLRAKKGRSFQDLVTRCLIVSAVRGVDYVVPFEIDGDLTVREALRRLQPDVFTKGGDRVDAHTIAEWDLCQELGIEVVTGVGADKQWSSSWFLDAWAQAAR